jgi:hypothetical protein
MNGMPMQPPNGLPVYSGQPAEHYAVAPPGYASAPPGYPSGQYQGGPTSYGGLAANQARRKMVRAQQVRFVEPHSVCDQQS